MGTKILTYDIRMTCGAYRIEARGPIRMKVARTGDEAATRPLTDVVEYSLENYAIRHADGRLLEALTWPRLEVRTWEGTWCVDGDDQFFAVHSGRPVFVRRHNNETPVIRWLDGEPPGSAKPDDFTRFLLRLRFDLLAQFEASGIAPPQWRWDPSSRTLSTDIPAE
jgi:hypothetical protein